MNKHEHANRHLVANFVDLTVAERASRLLVDSGFEANKLEVATPPGMADTGRTAGADQHVEDPSAVSGKLAGGALKGQLIGAAIGAVIGAIVGFAIIGGGFGVAFFIVATFAGFVAGAVIGGFRRARERTAKDAVRQGLVQLTLHTNDEDEAKKAAAALRDSPLTIDAIELYDSEWELLHTMPTAPLPGR